MREAVVLLAIAALSLMQAGESFAQDRKGTVGFEQNDRVFTWRTFNNGDFPLTAKVGVHLDSEMSTSLNQSSGPDVKDRWNDKVYNQAMLNYSVTNRVALKFLANEDWNKDTMNSFGKSLLTTNYGGLLRYTRSRQVWIEGSLEHTYDTRFDNEDKGSTANTSFSYTGNPLKSNRNLETHFELDAGTSYMRRKNDRLSYSGTVSYGHEFADVALKFDNRQTLRGYFSDIDRKNIEERKQLDQNIELTVAHGDANAYGSRSAFALAVNLGSGMTEDSANEIEGSSKYLNNSTLGLRDFQLRATRRFWKIISAGWETGYRKDEKEVQNKIRSRTQTDVETRGDLIVTVGAADSVTTFGWIKRTRIDTPKGDFDRDELKLETGVKYNHRFSNNFQITFDFRVLETHYVNIDVSQSSQNKRMKTYLLAPSLVYTPAPFLSIRHGLNLYANYIEYDFENPFLLRSNITRRFSSETWVNAALSSRTSAQLGFMIEENDYGKLNPQGDKIPAEEGIKRFGDLSIEYTFAEWLVVKPRYIYSIRKDWNDTGTFLKLYRREIDQTYGIECKLFKNKTNNYDFVVGVKRIVRETETNPPRIRNYVNMMLRYSF